MIRNRSKTKPNSQDVKHKSCKYKLYILRSTMAYRDIKNNGYPHQKQMVRLKKKKKI